MEIIVNKKTRKINDNNRVIEIGNDGENLQDFLIFTFDDEFVNGQARLEYELEDGTKNYIILEKDNESYKMPIKSIITKAGLINMQLVITENEQNEGIPLFKSNKFPVRVHNSINAVEEAPEGYEQWIEVANEKLNEIDSTIDDLQDKVDSGYFDGQDGQNGQDGLTPTIGNNGNWYLGETDTGKPSRGIQGEMGVPGSAGQDGISPIANITKSGNTATITITDKNGTTTATVSDGTNGVDGQPGRDGYRQYTAGDNITIENDVISADVPAVDLSKYPKIYPTSIATSSQRPFIFAGKEIGIYTFYETSTATFYFKGQENSSNQSYGISPLYINIFKKYEDTQHGEIFATLFGNAYGNLQIGSFIAVKREGQIPNVTYTIVPYLAGITTGNQTFTGVKTFNSIPKQGNTNAPTNDAEFTNKKYVDDMLANTGGFDENNIYSGTTTNPFDFDNKQGIYIADGTATTNYFYYKLNEEDTSKMISAASGRIYMMVITKKINDVASGTESIGVAIFVDNSNFLDRKGNFNILDLLYDADNQLIKLGAAISPVFKMLTSTEQNIQGRKNFQTIPFLAAGLTPQYDTQLVHKKYVDDSIASAIGDINTILASMTTPGGGE